MTIARLPGYLLLCAAMACLSHAHAQSRWSATFAGNPPEPLALDGVQPQRDGSVLVRGKRPPGHYWFLLLDAGLRVVDRAYGGQYTKLPLGAAAGDGSIALLPYFNDGIEVQPPSRLCWVWKDALGSLDVRATHDTVGPHADTPFERRLDAGGVYYGMSVWTGLVGFEPDCNARHFSAPWEWPREVIAVPTAEAAYFAGMGEDANLHLTRVEGDRTVWTRSLGEARAAPGLELHAAPDGDVVVWQYTNPGATGPQRRVITRIDSAGTVRWSKTYEADPLPSAVLVDGDRTLVIHGDAGACSGVSSVGVASLDSAGAERWRQSLATCHVHGLYDADPARARLLADADGALWSPGETGLQVFSQPLDGYSPLARAADGRILMAKGDVAGFGATLAVRDADSPAAQDVSLDAPVPGVPVAAFHDAQGAFVVTQDLAGSADLVHFAPSGQLRWRRPLSLPARLDNEIPPGRFDVAANDDRFCIWHQTASYTIAFRSHLACFERGSGAPLFPWVDLPFDYSGVDPTLTVRADGSVDALGVGCYFEPPATTCFSRARRFILDPQGQLLRTDEYGRLHAGTELGARAISAPTSGDIAVFHNPPEGTRIAVYDRDAMQRWSLPATGQVDPLMLSDDGSLLLRSEGRFELRDRLGALRWHYTLPASADVAATGIRAAMLSSGDVFLFASTWDGKRFRARLRAADGVPVWEIADAAQSRYDYLSTLRASDDGRFVFLVPRWSEDQRFIAFSMQDGAIVGAAARTIPPPMKSGAAVAAVAGDGSLLIAQGLPSAGRTEVEFRTPGMQLAPSADSAAAFPGTWHAQDAPGQGFAFHEEGGVVYGAWFTYSSVGGHGASEQRWYTLVSDGPFDAAGTSFAIFRSAPGEFAQGPATAATQVGTASLSTLDCNGLLLTFAFDTSEQEGRNGVIPLTRVSPASAACDAAAPSTSDSSGAWYDPQAGGQGVLFDLRPSTATSAGMLAGGWFTFDAHAQPGDDTKLHWFTLAGAPASPGSDEMHVTIYRTVGGRLDAEPTNNTWEVGHATLKLLACDRATLEYTFLDDPIAHAFRGRHGLVPLQRAMPCAASATKEAVPDS